MRSARRLPLPVDRRLRQSGSVAKAVAGYTFEDAAKEAEGTKNFHSNDGVLTFAIVTHTAGNGFFDPVYVGAQVATDLIGAKVLLLGSESPVDDPARELEILNQIVQDPTLDGLIMTTPQAGAYDDIVRTARANGIPVATTNSFDGGIFDRLSISHTGQDASAAAIAGAAMAHASSTVASKAVPSCSPSSTALGNIEVNNRVSSAYNATMQGILKTLALGVGAVAMMAGGAYAQSGLGRQGGRRLQLRGRRQGSARHQEFPFGRRPPDLRHRHPHGRQRLLRPGLCRRDGRRQHDRREDPAARLRIADRRSGPRDRNPEPDHPGSDASTASS